MPRTDHTPAHTREEYDPQPDDYFGMLSGILLRVAAFGTPAFDDADGLDWLSGFPDFSELVGQGGAAVHDAWNTPLDWATAWAAYYGVEVPDSVLRCAPWIVPHLYNGGTPHPNLAGNISRVCNDLRSTEIKIRAAMRVKGVPASPFADSMEAAPQTEKDTTGETATPPLDPILRGKSEILDVLGRPDGDENWRWIRRFAEKFDGCPVQFVRGGDPYCGREALKKWWRTVEDRHQEIEADVVKRETSTRHAVDVYTGKTPKHEDQPPSGCGVSVVKDNRIRGKTSRRDKKKK